MLECPNGPTDDVIPALFHGIFCFKSEKQIICDHGKLPFIWPSEIALLMKSAILKVL